MPQGDTARDTQDPDKAMHTIPVRPANGRKCAVTIGNFDGVHRGHGSLIRRAQASGSSLSLNTKYG